jgi:hypothetical protein
VRYFSTLTSRVINDESRVSVEKYLTALQAADYDRAYNLLCDSLQNQVSRARFAAEKREDAPISGFEVTEVKQRSNDVLVTARITYAGSPTQTITYTLVPDEQGTTAMEVCGPY